MKHKFGLKSALVIFALLVSGVGGYFGLDQNGSSAVGELQDGTAAIEAAFKDQKSKVWVEVSGHASKLLRDDLKGSKHQRFILTLDNGQTVLVAHNIDLAPRVPLKQNDKVTIRGRYEWNNKGGVLHWTHHDPKKRIEGGWIDYVGKRYE